MKKSYSVWHSRSSNFCYINLVETLSLHKKVCMLMLCLLSSMIDWISSDIFAGMWGSSVIQQYFRFGGWSQRWSSQMCSSLSWYYHGLFVAFMLSISIYYYFCCCCLFLFCFSNLELSPDSSQCRIMTLIWGKRLKKSDLNLAIMSGWRWFTM